MRIYLSLVLIFFTTDSLSLNHNIVGTIKKSSIKTTQFKEGKALYLKNCASCHKKNLSGQINWDAKLDKDGHRLAPPMNGDGHTWHHDDSTLFYITKYGLGRYVKNYKGKMGGFSDKLTDNQIKNVLAYVKSYWPEKKYRYQLKLNER